MYTLELLNQASGHSLYLTYATIFALRIFKLYSFSNFQVYNTLLLTVVTTLYNR